MTSATIYKYRFAVALLCLLSAGGMQNSFGAVRFDVVGSPTEVVSTGGSEVLGSINLIVSGAGNVTGTSTGGAVQLGFIFSNPALPIDNTTTAGINLVWSSGFDPASPSIVSVTNLEIGMGCAGFLTLNLLPGATPSEGDFIRIEGIRGRIYKSAGVIPGSDLFVDIQSINDPSANSFAPDRVRVAKSLKGLSAEVVANGTMFEIRMAEGFSRSFVDRDASNDGVNSNDRIDSSGNATGAPTNSTQITIFLNDIDESITGVTWPLTSTFPSTGAMIYRIDQTFTGSSASVTYSYEAVDQVSSSDLVIESFAVSPGFLHSGARCHLPLPTAAVTLAPAVSETTGCSAPSPGSNRPRFLTVFELSVQKLSPTTVVVGSDDLTVTVYGTGFVEGSTVLWNGSPRTTTFLSGTRISAQILATDINKVGTGEVTVSNPQTLGGGISNILTLTIEPHALTLYFPRLVSTLGDSEPGTSEVTGIALANISGRIAVLELTALDKTGAKITGPDIANPATLTLAAGEQMPLIASQIFGSGLAAADSIGWIRAEGNVEQVVGFFLTFNDILSRLDGADVSGVALNSFVLPEIWAGGINQVHIANPVDESVGLTLELMRADGTLRTIITNRTVEANGVLIESLAELFPNAPPVSSNYLKVTASHGVVPFEYLGMSGDVIALNGQDGTDGSTTLYCPQYVVGGPDWQSTLSIINLSSSSGTITLVFIGDDGTQIGATQPVQIAAWGKAHITDQDLFLDAGGQLTQGYLVIQSDGIELAGNVVFGHPSGESFYAALPLVAELRTGMVFSQVASNNIFFTGLAILNPNDVQANAIIQVFNRDGEVIASKIEILPAKGRRSKLLTEYFPQLKAVSLDSGYIQVTSIRGLAGFALFGAIDLSVLSAVPPQIVP